jgi:ComF family protein
MFSSVFNLQFFFPYTCVLCHGKSERALDLCLDCEQDLPLVKNVCRYCGIHLDGDIKVCGRCLKNPPPFDYTFALCYYQHPITQLVTNLKFHHQLINAKILGELMAERLVKSRDLPECIIPVPLHSKRLKERGFNQSLEIARPIARSLKIPIDIKSCKRIRHTEAQTIIPAKLRKKNIKNAFKVDESFNAKHVAIVDDVVTTGNTISELSRMLRKVGVERIEVWCCARTAK